MGGNNEGVIGMISEPPTESSICLLTARVFDDSGTTSTSNINAAIEWCGDNKSRVINMSLGGSGPPSDATQKIYKQLYEKENVLIIAAGRRPATGGDNDNFKLPSKVSKKF